MHVTVVFFYHWKQASLISDAPLSWSRQNRLCSHTSVSSILNTSKQVLVFLSPVMRFKQGRAVTNNITIKLKNRVWKTHQFRVLAMLRWDYSRRHCFDSGSEFCGLVLMVLLLNQVFDRETFDCKFVRGSSKTNRKKNMDFIRINVRWNSYYSNYCKKILWHESYVIEFVISLTSATFRWRPQNEHIFIDEAFMLSTNYNRG